MLITLLILLAILLPINLYIFYKIKIRNEKKFFEKEYYHMDFSLGNFFIDKENGKIAFIDFDDIVRKPPFFRKRLYLTKSIRSFEGSMKFFLSVKNFSKEENQKIIDRLEEIKKQYGVVSRKKDLEMAKKILNR